MSDVPGSPDRSGSTADEAPADGGPAGTDWERRKHLADVFGEVLPETTSDERETKAPGDDAGEAWLRAQVPPHHG